MSRHVVSKRDLKDIQARVDAMGIGAISLESLEVEENRDEKVYFVRGKPVLYVKDSLIPTLFFINSTKPAGRWITVDNGAVPHIMNGANVFAQGIRDMDRTVVKGDMVFVKNLDGVYIAVGIAELSGEEIMADRKGEAVRTIHYPGDRIFKAYQEK
jgi:PUA domain protein